MRERVDGTKPLGDSILPTAKPKRLVSKEGIEHLNGLDLTGRIQIHIEVAETTDMDGERRLLSFAEDALALITDAAGGTGEELPKEGAIEVITDDERFDEADAAAALEMLQSRGYVYYVGEYVRITPTDD